VDLLAARGIRVVRQQVGNICCGLPVVGPLLGQLLADCSSQSDLEQRLHRHVQGGGSGAWIRTGAFRPHLSLLPFFSTASTGEATYVDGVWRARPSQHLTETTDWLFEIMPVSLDASFLTIIVSISICISISTVNLDRFLKPVCAYACDYVQIGQGLQYGTTEGLMWFRGVARTTKGYSERLVVSGGGMSTLEGFKGEEGGRCVWQCTGCVSASGVSQ
jgi:hypothetical protein